MQCEKCGNSILPTQAFCPFCGKLNEQTVAPNRTPKKSAGDYAAPKAEIHSENTVFIDPNRAYDRKANEFYRPHSLPHSDRRSSKRRHHSKKRKYKIIKALAAVFAFSIIGMALFLKLVPNQAPPINIKGSWVVSDGSTERQGYVYRFTNEGYVKVQKSETDPVEQQYFYRIEDENTLRVNQTCYIWNDNLNDFLSGDPYWYTSDNYLYLSSTTNNGYLILNKIQK